MQSGKSKKMIVIFFVVIAIILAIIYFLIQANLNNKNSNDANNTTENDAQTSQEEKFRNIRLDEDLNIDGMIEGLENARYNHVRIMQHDSTLEFSVDIDNESKEEIIPSTELTINILDKKAKTILTKNVQMEEIESNYGYTSIDLEFEIKEPVIVYDVEIIANK